MSSAIDTKQFSKQEITGFWHSACRVLEKQLTPAVYQTWIVSNPLADIATNDDGLQAVITCPTAFHATNLKRNLHQVLEKTLTDVVGQPLSIHYHVGSWQESAQSESQTNSPTPSTNHSSITMLSSQQHSPPSPIISPRASDLFSETTIAQSFEDKLLWRTKQVGLNPDFTFDTFAVSSTNEMAHAAATAVAHHPGQAYNPLFLYGAVGVGKTHLMHAIGNNALAQNLDYNIVYCTGEEFTNQIVQAIQSKQASSFKHKFRTAQILFIDDIQFIAGKNTVQEEFFHTFNSLIQQRHQVVLTSDRPPQEISLLEDRLRSRFEAGLMIDIGQPSFELRTAILLLKARQAKIELPIELAKRVADQVESARKIEGFITMLRSEIELKGRVVDETLVSQVLQHTTREEVKPKIIASPSDVIRKVSQHFGVKQTELRGKARQKHLVTARHVAMYILKEDLHLSLVEIGRWLANRDHTSVIHGVRKIKQDLSFNSRLQTDIDAIRHSLIKSRS